MKRKIVGLAVATLAMATFTIVTACGKTHTSGPDPIPTPTPTPAPSPIPTVTGVTEAEACPPGAPVIYDDGKTKVCELEGDVKIGKGCTILSDAVLASGKLVKKIGVINKQPYLLYTKPVLFQDKEANNVCLGSTQKGSGNGLTVSPTQVPANANAILTYESVIDGNSCQLYQGDDMLFNSVNGIRISTMSNTWLIKRACPKKPIVSCSISPTSGKIGDIFTATVSSTPEDAPYSWLVTNGDPASGNGKSLASKATATPNIVFKVTSKSGQTATCDAPVRDNTCDDYEKPGPPNWTGELALTNQTPTTVVVTQGTISPVGTLDPALPSPPQLRPVPGQHASFQVNNTKNEPYGPEGKQCSVSYSHTYSIDLPPQEPKCNIVGTKTVSPSGTVTPDTTLAYGVQITNSGTTCVAGSCTNVKITDNIPDHVRYVNGSASSSGVCHYQGKSGNTLTWNCGEVAPGTSVTVTWKGEVKNPHDNCQDFTITNTAHISSSEQGSVPTNSVSTLVDVTCPVCSTDPATSNASNPFTLYNSGQGVETAWVNSNVSPGPYAFVDKDDFRDHKCRNASMSAKVVLLKAGTDYWYFLNVTSGQQLCSGSKHDISHFSYFNCASD